MMEALLQDQHVLITRGGTRGEKLSKQIQSIGGTPHIIPLIAFHAHDDKHAQTYIHQLFDYDWIVFTSTNGVNHFFDHLGHQVDPEKLRNSPIKFAVVGEKTKQALESYGIKSTFMPNIYTAEDFSKQYFAKQLQATRVLIAKGNLASETIANAFRSERVDVDEWIVYDTYLPAEAEEQLISLLSKDKLGIATFTSPSSFRHFEQIVHKHQLQMKTQDLSIATIGTVTKKAVEAAGYTVQICPKTFTFDAMFDEICNFYRNRKEGK